MILLSTPYSAGDYSILRKKRNRTGSVTCSRKTEETSVFSGRFPTFLRTARPKAEQGRYNVLLSDDVDVQRYTDAVKKSPFDRTPRFGFGADSLEEMNRDYNKKHGTYKDPFEVR
jgi:hypothetical protein